MEEHDPLDTMLREGRRFLDKALGEGASKADGMNIGPPTDSRAHIAASARPSVEAGQIAGSVALAWGMLKAIYECPNCPGHYRVPMEPAGEGWQQMPYERASDDANWIAIACPQCQGLWTRKQELKQAVQHSLFDDVA